MRVEEMFAGFHVPAGEDRFGERIRIGELAEPSDCKVSGQDTHGAMCVLEFTGASGGPRHLHREQDEWVYVLEGTCCFEVAGEHRTLAAGESLFIPRKTPHGWASENGTPCKLLNVYQPAGQIEAFFRAVSRAEALPTLEDCAHNTFTPAHVQTICTMSETTGVLYLGCRLPALRKNKRSLAIA